MNRFGEILRQGWRGAKNQAGVTLAALALFLLAFLLGTHLFFPVAALQSWLVGEVAARTPVSVQIERLSPFPVFTLSGQRATVFFDGRSLPPVVLDNLRLKPLWATLVTGNPGLSMEATLQQGQIEIAVRRSGDLALHAEGLQLKAFPVSQDTLALLSGTIVKGDLRGSFPTKKSAQNQLSLEMDNASLTVMGQPIALGKLSVQGNGQGSSLRIASLTASGSDLSASGTGSLLLGTTTATSRISLDLTLRPSRSASANVAALLDLTGKRQADGSYHLRLNGPPGQLIID